MSDHLLVPSDGSEDSERAADRAREIAEETGARVTLVHVIGELEIGGLDLISERELEEELKERETPGGSRAARKDRGAVRGPIRTACRTTASTAMRSNSTTGTSRNSTTPDWFPTIQTRTWSMTLHPTSARKIQSRRRPPGRRDRIRPRFVRFRPDCDIGAEEGYELRRERGSRTSARKGIRNPGADDSA
jgi:hypothetical protein